MINYPLSIYFPINRCSLPAGRFGHIFFPSLIFLHLPGDFYFRRRGLSVLPFQELYVIFMSDTGQKKQHSNRARCSSAVPLHYLKNQYTSYARTLLFRKSAPEKSDDLRSGAVVVGAKQAAAYAVGDVVHFRPFDCLCIIGVSCHIGESRAVADFRTVGHAVQEADHLCAGANVVGTEL